MWPVLLVIPLGLGLAAFLLAGKAQARPADETVGEKAPAPVDDKQAALRRALVATGIVEDAWLRFFEATARRESNFSPRAHNDSPSEKGYSRDLVYRVNKKGEQPNVKRLEAIGQDPEAWTFGSKGLFQFLGPNVALRNVGLRFPKSAVNPDMAFDPGIATAAALDFARGLMASSHFQGTWASLAAGWGGTWRMSNPDAVAKMRDKIEMWAERVGWPKGWADQEVPRTLPKRTASANLTVAKAAKAAYYL